MNNPPKILLVHLFSNGDCLYATAVARQIKQDYPGCHLTWAIATSCKPIIDNNPYVDAVWPVDNVTKAESLRIQRSVAKEAEARKTAGEFDEVFYTQLIDYNIANYDGTIRTGIFRGYPRPITVPVTPVLRLRDGELENARLFAERNRLSTYDHVILFEFAPLSGQLAITDETAVRIAREVTTRFNAAVILSSARKIDSGSKAIIDGSALTIRETAAVTHYCTLLLGCSSGITWISTSDAAKPLPMIEMLDPNAFWVNPVSRDFERCGFSTDNLIELYDNNTERVIACVSDALSEGFAAARKKYYRPLPVQFVSTSRSIYNMLVQAQFGAIARHIRLNVAAFGWNPGLLWAIFYGFASAPIIFGSNFFNKKILGRKPKW